MKYISLLAIVIIVSACAKFHKIKVRTNAKGHQIAHYENRNLPPIRDNNFNLITDRSKAQKRLTELGSFDQLERFTPKACKVGHSESKKYHKTQKLLKEKKYDEAIILLNQIRAKCENIVFVSHINYLYAYAYDNKGEKKKAINYIKLFIHKAQSIYPQSFYQFDSPNSEIELYEKYLMNAHDYLEGKPLTLGPLLKPRFNTLKATLLPGFKADKKNRYLWEVGYSSISGGAFGLGYIFNTGYGEVIPFIQSTSRLGNFKSLLYKKQHFQTHDRKHTTGFIASIDEWKRFTYYKDYLDRIKDVKVKDSGYGATIGYGGTYQFNNDYSFVYSAKVRVNYETQALGTSMISYHTGGPGTLLTGLYNNESVIMWKVGPIQIWKNFTDDSINSSLTAGIMF